MATTRITDGVVVLAIDVMSRAQSLVGHLPPGRLGPALGVTPAFVLMRRQSQQLNHTDGETANLDEHRCWPRRYSSMRILVHKPASEQPVALIGKPAGPECVRTLSMTTLYLLTLSAIPTAQMLYGCRPTPV